MADRRRLPRFFLIAVQAALFWTGSLPIHAAKTPEPKLEGLYARWLTSVAHLASPEERALFEGLDHDILRELFIHRFWSARGDGSPPRPGGPLARWRRNFDRAMSLYEDLDDARAQAVLMAGVPPRTIRLDCDDHLRRIEIWSYDPWHAANQSGRPDARGFTLLFYRDGPFERTTVHQWSPDMGVMPLTLGGPGQTIATTGDVLRLAAQDRCLRAPGARDLLKRGLEQALNVSALREHLAALPTDGERESGTALDWVDDFRTELADLRPSAALLPGAPLELLYPGRYNDQRTLLEGRIVVPADRFARTADGSLFDRVTIEGDIWQGTRLRDGFRADYYLAGRPPADDVVRLAFYRRLRPGTYTLSMRATDAGGLALVRETREIVVPRLENDAEPPAGNRQGFTALTRADVGTLVTFPSLEILPQGAEVTGRTELVAVTTGGPIDRVSFQLDDEAPISDHEPPWSTQVDLGLQPIRHTVIATAYDADGRVLADDRLALNAAPPRFAVRLTKAEKDANGRQQVTVAVDVPAGETLEYVDLFLNDRRLERRRGEQLSPAFTLVLPDLLPQPTAFVRAVASLASGAELEDLLIVRSRVPVESIDVQLVELYVSVLDGRGRGITGLPAEAFTVREDGRARPLVRFARVADLPIDVGLLMDVSASMRRGLATAADSAQRFFDTVIGTEDQAMLVSFNHQLELLTPFTGDTGQLRYATTGLRAWGTTRLRDGIVFSLHGFGGQQGRRALIVLSDGQDVDSDFDADQVLVTAQQTGVAVYPVVLGSSEPESHSELVQLAQETGGRVFTVASVAGLDQVYRQIEDDLRAQYLLVYQPPEENESREFRHIDVSVTAPGARVRTISGYHP